MNVVLLLLFISICTEPDSYRPIIETMLSATLVKNLNFRRLEDDQRTGVDYLAKNPPERPRRKRDLIHKGIIDFKNGYVPVNRLPLGNIHDLRNRYLSELNDFSGIVTEVMNQIRELYYLTIPHQGVDELPIRNLTTRYS